MEKFKLSFQNFQYINCIDYLKLLENNFCNDNLGFNSLLIESDRIVCQYQVFFIYLFLFNFKF